MEVKQVFGLIRRPWGPFYLKSKITDQQTSDKFEARRILYPERFEMEN